MNSYKKYGYAIKKILLIYLTKRHNQIVLCGLVVGLCYYLFFWLKTLTQFIIIGITFPLLTVTAAYLALQELWQQKNQLAKLNPPNIQRRLGHSLILFGVGLFPFSLNKGWSQALVWLIILIGVVLSTWGHKFFKHYLRPIFLMVLSIYPGIFFLPAYIWQALTPERTMDRIQAWSVNLALHAIGYPSSLDQTWVKLPTGSIEIGWGCNGFDLMVLMVMTSLLIGIAYRLKGFQILTISFLGCIVAFIFNTARIALLAISVAYWDATTFDFWHDGWGGQIFSAAMFTAFYYLLIQMRLLNFDRKSKLQ
ncbi:cyanoexosortase C [Halotia branconii]|uniref:Cyanoexosortase C n=1 Tax=Halotia branconii CENA392 TaxID=1539056 RepID=A0AAJ6NS47_9CYAN|nr:cyanoexosortase C [Halotia branconii]WGV25690.1 cyanoexosortase C [Halotia branconii CENA392]